MVNPLDKKIVALKRASKEMAVGDAPKVNKWLFKDSKSKRAHPGLDHMIKKCQDYYDLCIGDPTKLPTLADLSQTMGISLGYLHKARSGSDDLDAVLVLLTEMQEDRLILGGLKNKYNANFVMFMLKARHNYKEQPHSLTQNNTFQINKDLVQDALEFAKKNKLTYGKRGQTPQPQDQTDSVENE